MLCCVNLKEYNIIPSMVIKLYSTIIHYNIFTEYHMYKLEQRKCYAPRITI